MHLQTAFDILSKNPQYSSIFEGLDISFYKYSPNITKDTTVKKLNMGAEALRVICENHSKIPNEGMYIFIADRDIDKINSKMGSNTAPYKEWGNNVFSFLIPVPSFRKDNPKICIEHLYPDNDIKTEIEVENVKRRLFIGNEFDDRGIANSIDRFCESHNKCGSDSIAIIEGSNGEKVTSIKNNNGVNYALSKMKFAEYVSDHPKEFHFEGFIEVFEIIRSIVLGG